MSAPRGIIDALGTPGLLSGDELLEELLQLLRVLRRQLYRRSERTCLVVRLHAQACLARQVLIGGRLQRLCL